MPLSPLQLRMLAKTSPQLALLEFMKEMEKKNKESLEMIIYEIEKKMEATLDAKIILFASQIKSKHDQRLIQDIVSDTLANIKGEDGKDADEDAIAKRVLENIRIPEDGDDGRTPVPGVDYPTERQVRNIIQEMLPKAGQEEKYLTEKDIEGIIVRLKKEFPNSFSAMLAEKIADAVQPKKLRDALQTLKGSERLDRSAVKGLDELLQQVREMGRSTRQIRLGGGGGGITELTATGAINGNNVTFTFTKKPNYIVNDNAWYKEGDGFSWSGLTATMTVAPSNSIYGII